MTVAVLDAAVATDQAWRTFFASTANALRGRDGRPSFLHADFSAPEPWVAYAADSGSRAEQVFVALGMEYRPTSSPAQATESGALEPPWAKLAIAEPTQALPVSNAGASAVPGPPEGHSLNPVSAGPVSPASPVSVPPSSAADGPSPWSEPYQTSYPPLPRPGAPARPRRRGLWVGVAVAVVVVLGAVVGIVAWRSAGGTPDATGPSASPSATVSSSPEPVAFPTGAPRKPGVEPPKAGSWPLEPQFDDTDRVKAESPAGFGFTFKVPESWACDARQRGPGFARHVCGISRPGVPEVGGEIIVRNCPAPCGDEVRAAYRRAEEAWGLQWTQVGDATFVETAQLNGKPRYGVVVIGWWRSRPGGAIDRQVVIRMTAAGAQVSEVRKVVNGIRATLSF
ncbi:MULTISPECIES: hypothetical protein [Micromonospora]|uniref:Uncharacterized protein n=1 Tax=Micromonospora solifontis TaxID=2487138 RepID=A0ABX9WGI0_9ACTN|nr:MULTISPECIES: hypothetical protein [Micromonospora]NES15125.1 hypothetical protein [Micromonospora sp. PPF5-17B]NES36868.1 hypothetical protein [Micromonospora solifontis]NES56460.1 hypothetical protein [Micromonospora sp. PPF5-6]RNL99056.1 hypothetical protein EFE23_11975 [Micromonospora solifontis]